MSDPEDADITLTVGELIQRLSVFPAETPVLATWEGVYEVMGVCRELYEGKLVIVADGIDRQYWGEHWSAGKPGAVGWY